MRSFRLFLSASLLAMSGFSAVACYAADAEAKAGDVAPISSHQSSENRKNATNAIMATAPVNALMTANADGNADSINHACTNGLPKSIDVTSDDISKSMATGEPLFEVSAGKEHSDTRCSFTVKADSLTQYGDSAYLLGLRVSKMGSSSGFHSRELFIKNVILNKDANGQAHAGFVDILLHKDAGGHYYGTLSDAQDKVLFPIRLINSFK